MAANSSSKSQDKHNLPNFGEYCTIRDFIHMQMMSNGCPVTSYGDPTYDTLLNMENQWQYMRSPIGIFNYQSSYSFPNSIPFVAQTQTINFAANNVPSVNQNTEQSLPQEKKKSIKRKRKVNDGRPKRPLTSFMMFLRDFRESIVPTLPSGSSSHDVNRTAGQRWHSLSESDKEAYKIRAAEALKQWKEVNPVPKRDTSTTSDKLPIKKRVERENTGSEDKVEEESDNESTDSSSSNSLPTSEDTL